VSFTVTFTVSLLVPPLPSFTVNWKVNMACVETRGDVNVGFAVVALESVTVVPAVWLQEYDRLSPSGSLLPEPFKVTTTPSPTVWSGPALAVEAELGVGVGVGLGGGDELGVGVGLGDGEEVGDGLGLGVEAGVGV
jgi:hypothetical protein